MFDSELLNEDNGELLLGDRKIGDVHYAIKTILNKGISATECKIRLLKTAPEQIAFLDRKPEGLLLRLHNGKTLKAKITFINLSPRNYDLLLTLN